MHIYRDNDPEQILRTAAGQPSLVDSYDKLEVIACYSMY